MRKIYKIFFIFSLFIIIFSSRYVYGISFDDMKDQYNKNKNIVNELTEEELQEWKDECQRQRESLLGNQGATSTDDANALIQIESAIEQRERGENKDSIKDKSDEEIEKMKEYSPAEIISYLEKANPDDIENIPDDLLEAWQKEIDENGNQINKIQFQGLLDGKSLDEIDREIAEQTGSSGGSADDVLYKKPAVVDSGDSSQSLDDMMSDGDDFVQSATDNPIDTAQLQSVSSNLFNIFVEVGVALAVIVGLVIGIKYMYSSVDQKAEIKKLLVPYLVGCVVIFGALGIWKFVVTLLQTV